MMLKPPPRNLRELDLATVNIPAVNLFRISKYAVGGHGRYIGTLNRSMAYVTSQDT